LLGEGDEGLVTHYCSDFYFFWIFLWSNIKYGFQILPSECYQTMANVSGFRDEREKKNERRERASERFWDLVGCAGRPFANFLHTESSVYRFTTHTYIHHTFSHEFLVSSIFCYA